MTSDSADRLRAALRRALQGPLPGRAAHRVAWPDDLPGRLDPPDAGSYQFAAVLIALHPPPSGASRFLFPLIRRPEGIGHHPGQIALPGGRCAGDEDPCACALREAEEEIGLPRDTVEILGRLTPVPVSVSRNRIQPVVGWVRRPEPERGEPASAPLVAAGMPDPRWRPQAGEVEDVLPADPDRLAEEAPRRVRLHLRTGEAREVPAWIVSSPQGNAVVWGATAIILAEFLALWRNVRGA